jgi:hypothetical protein
MSVPTSRLERARMALIRRGAGTRLALGAALSRLDRRGRTAAAVALSFEGSPEERARLGVAASACASARIRVALTTAAEGEIDAEAITNASVAEGSAR